MKNIKKYISVLVAIQTILIPLLIPSIFASEPYEVFELVPV